MPLSPQRHRRVLSATAGNHALANADQSLTEVDTRLTALDARLTKVDKGCQKLTPSTPAPTPNLSVNLRCQPHQRTLNNPEQIRTNLNKPEHRRTPRPDRTAPESPSNTRKKTNPEHPRRPPFRHSCAGRNHCASRRLCPSTDG